MKPSASTRNPSWKAMPAGLKHRAEPSSATAVNAPPIPAIRPPSSSIEKPEPQAPGVHARTAVTHNNLRRNAIILHKRTDPYTSRRHIVTLIPLNSRATHDIVRFSTSQQLGRFTRKFLRVLAEL